MPWSPRAQFAILTFVGVVVGFALGAVFGPPDPFEQVRIAAGVVTSAVVVAYVLVYRPGPLGSGDGS